MSEPVLELSAVRNTVNGRVILDVPRLAVARAESLALVGPNGAGKTTLLHVAALLHPPDQGTIHVLGEAVSPRNAAMLRRNLAVVFQQPLLFDISVLANAAAGARFQGLPGREAEQRASGWLERFGVAHLSRRKARTLSGGEVARVALARAFATDPALLLLDEPFSALDAPTRAQLLPTLRDRLRETGASSILVTHDLEEAFAFANRIAFIDQGQILATGDPRSLMARPPTRRVAELLGIENILPVSIVSVEGQTATVELSPGTPLVSVKAGGGGIAPGQAATFVIPAGASRVSGANEPVAAGENALVGILTAVTETRSGTRLIIATPTSLVAMAPWSSASRDWVVGDKVTLAFAPDAGSLILDS